MKFKFHLYAQKHANGTYTVTPVLLYDLTTYGPTLEEVKAELAEAIAERVADTAPGMLQHLEFDPKLEMRKVRVQLRPVDRKKQKKRREQVEIVFSVLVKPNEDKQLVVTVPRLGEPPLTFLAYNWDELEETARIEIVSWLDDETLEDLQVHQHARSEFMDSLEVEVALKKAKERTEAKPRWLASDDDDDGFWALKEVGINLTAQAAEGRFRRAYHREDEVEAILQILVSARHNSALVVGPAESGKTAVVHEVIRRIKNEDCDEALQGRQVWLLTPDRIIAGAQYIGTWEERINNIVDECRQQRHVLYVQDLPGLLEVGRWSKSDVNVAMSLKPHLASGEVIIIGETSPDRLRMGESLGPGFINLFRRVEVRGMAEDETLSLLGNVARDIERDLDVRVLPDAIQMSVGLSRRFWPYRAFPGKAIRLLEEAASDMTQLRNRARRPSSGSLLRRIHATRVGHEQVIETFSRFSGLPEFIVNDGARMSIPEVENYFFERIIGQDEAVETMVDLVATVKAGLNDPQQPLGSFLFIGPTGVGKTQMAKTLTSYIFGDESRLMRFDMSEYGDVDGLARLIGAFDKEGELTRQVREQPFSVILLDEFEKASSRIYDIFLQVLGEGRLTDARGRTTFFHNAILILTSNLGGEARSFRPPGFSADDAIDPTEVNAALKAHYLEQIEQYFRPEFVNRLDKIVVFGQLSPQAIRDIATRELNEVLVRDGIMRRRIPVEIDSGVIDLVLEKGYSPEYGARLLKREIERRVVAPMARSLAQRSAEDGQHLLRVVVEDGRLALKNVPIDDAGQKSTVTLASGLETATVRRQRMDLDDLVEGFAALRRKLSDWEESDAFKQMRGEKDGLLSSQQSAEFWKSGGDARDSMRRFYFLDRLTRRLRQLQERAEYLEDLAGLVSRERDLSYLSDLARDYEKLHDAVSFLDIEFLTAHLPHRNQAVMLITMMGSSLNPPDRPADAWHRRVSEIYLWWAERKGYDRELFLLTPDPNAPGGAAFTHLTAGSFRDVMKRYTRYEHTDQIAIWLEGSNVFGFLKGERGLHRYVSGDGVGHEELARVQVYALPDDTKIDDWLARYQRIKADIAAGRQPQPPQEKHSVIRVYSLDKGEKFVRDQRTGVRLTNIKEVMQRGSIDAFVLAYLRTEEGGTGWEDRFPPTFPF